MSKDSPAADFFLHLFCDKTRSFQLTEIKLAINERSEFFWNFLWNFSSFSVLRKSKDSGLRADRFSALAKLWLSKRKVGAIRTSTLQISVTVPIISAMKRNQSISIIGCTVHMHISWCFQAKDNARESCLGTISQINVKTFFVYTEDCLPCETSHLVMDTIRERIEQHWCFYGAYEATISSRLKPPRIFTAASRFCVRIISGQGRKLGKILFDFFLLRWHHKKNQKLKEVKKFDNRK